MSKAAWGLVVILVSGLGPTPGSATTSDAVTNGSFTTDATGWSFVSVSGAPTGVWDAAGHSNGGAAKVSSPTGASKSGQGRFEQALAGTILAGSTVSLSYAWRKAFEAKAPRQQDLYVSLIKPGGARVDLDARLGTPTQYGAWFNVVGKDVSASFDATGTYSIELRFAFQTGKSASARAHAWFDEVRVLVTPPSGGWVERASTPAAGGFGEAVAGTGSNVYVIRDATATSAPALWRFEPTANAWTTLGTAGLPAGAFRNGATLTWDGANALYALAGARYSDANRRAFYGYDVAANAWSTLPDAPAPEGAGDAASWSDRDQRLYAILGSNSHGTAFAAFDPAANAWTLRAAPPAGTDDGASLAWTGGAHFLRPPRRVHRVLAPPGLLALRCGRGRVGHDGFHPRAGRRGRRGLPPVDRGVRSVAR